MPEAEEGHPQEVPKKRRGQSTGDSPKAKKAKPNGESGSESEHEKSEPSVRRGAERLMCAPETRSSHARRYQAQHSGHGRRKGWNYQVSYRSQRRTEGKHDFAHWVEEYFSTPASEDAQGVHCQIGLRQVFFSLKC
jgi:hypothetical protein